MNIIIVGCGKVGSTIARQLNAEGHNIVVIDKKAAAVESLTDSLDIMGIEGNGATVNILSEAGVEQADLLIAVTAADELNLYCCLIAKRSGAKNTIARVRNPDYTNDVHLVKDELGLSLAINPEFTAANEMKRLLRYSGAIEIDTFAKGVVELYKIKVPHGSAVTDKMIKDLTGVIKGRTRICAVERDDEIFIPNGDFVLKAGDVISIIAAADEASKLFKCLGILTGKTKNVMIVGGGKTGFYLASLLLESGIDVKIIERDHKRCTELSELLPDATIICGDGMDQQLLLSEGVEHADGFASLMDLDEENILLSLYVKSVSKAKIITKINRISFKDTIDRLQLGSVIHPKDLTGEYIVRYVRAMQNTMGCNIETLYKIIDDKAEALEFRVREKNAVVGVPLHDLKLKDNLLVGCINRNGNVIIPCGKDTIELHDTVIIVTTHKGLKDLKDILK